MAGALRQLDRDLWVIDHPQRVGPLEFPTRTSLVRLREGGVVALSPGPLASTPLEAVRALGALRALVAPNLLHHLYLAAWSEAFPQARVWGAPGLAEKVKGLRLHEALEDKPPALWAADLDQLFVQGAPGMGEIAFLHRGSRTLIVTDLVFNFRHLNSRVSRLLMRLNDAYGRFGPSRLMRRVVTRDRAALRASLERILAWDFERVIVAHGDVLDSGGREALRQAFAWLG